MTNKNELIEQGTQIAYDALKYYEGWFDTNDPDDQHVIDSIETGLLSAQPLNSEYAKDALSDYQDYLKADIENNPDNQETIDLIDELFANQLV